MKTIIISLFIFFSNYFILAGNLSKNISSDIRQLFPRAVWIEKEGLDFALVYDQKKSCIGYLLYSSPSCDDISGYGGPIPLFIALNSKGTILGIKFLENKETSSYFSKVKKSSFLENWYGKPIEKAIRVSPDAISGATYSSEAIRKTIRKRIKKYIKEKK